MVGTCVDSGEYLEPTNCGAVPFRRLVVADLYSFIVTFVGVETACRSGDVCKQV